MHGITHGDAVSLLPWRMCCPTSVFITPHAWEDAAILLPTHIYTCSLDLLDAELVADTVKAGEQLVEEPGTQKMWNKCETVTGMQPSAWWRELCKRICKCEHINM